MAVIPDHIANLRSNVAEVERLLTIHTHLIGKGPGRRHDVQVLNKSAVLLVVATWESFVESLILTGAAYLSSHVEKTAQVPNKAKLAVSRRLKREKHDNAIWALAGEGWKLQLLAEAKERIRWLNTPTAANIDALFENVLGLQKLSSNWHWQGAIHQSAISRLMNLLTLSVRPERS